MFRKQENLCRDSRDVLKSKVETFTNPINTVQ